MAATGSETNCSFFFLLNKFATAVIPNADFNISPEGCFSKPSGVYVSVLNTFITKKTVPSITKAIPVIKNVPPITLNCVKSAGRGQYNVYNGA